MSSYVDMSLEDIIQKKKRDRPTKLQKSPMKMNRGKQRTQNFKLPLNDARNKIISKKRTQISDAREKLAELAKQKDARLKLDLLRKKRAQLQGRNNFQSHGKFIRTISNKERVFMDSSRQVVSQPLSHSRISSRRQINNKKFMENHSFESKFRSEIPRPKPIVRTVENDIELIDDPMGEEPMPSKITDSNRKASMQLRIIAHNIDSRDNKSSIMHRTMLAEKERSPPRPPSILKKRPMAALRNDKKTEKNEKPILEYRIIVSNLRNTVTGGDIEELFGDVGGMLESRLVRPGTAEVIYKTLEDAQRAVDLYHNRQLDGQPMNCLLVTPRSPTMPSRSNTKPALYSTNSNVEPDISTFHKVLFSNL
ncbi:polymerase delta-interacting protein 3-like [Galleria mellonella]|uniref:Polymerase delta-interacting protein 3-like n=1 Tax=Galleria mellonella TaxID=7137 RepID=A0A6J1WXV3_GALME|nr:polymerase delta-interacting protein 3-like [Galleria mellonella]